jgi:hypothetical protein
MRAACYDRQGPATAVLQVGDLPDPQPGHGEARVRLTHSGINPGRRARAFPLSVDGIEDLASRGRVSPLGSAVRPKSTTIKRGTAGVLGPTITESNCSVR